MTEQPILCPYCKLIGIRSSSYRVSFMPDKKTGEIVSTFKCQHNAEHKFKIDREGNVIDDGCKRCEDN